MSYDIPLANRPAHVPADRVRDFDIVGIQAPDAEYQIMLRRLLQGPGVPDLFWTPHNYGHWVAARAGIMQKIFHDTDHFSSRKIMIIPEMNPSPPWAPVQVDPPDHALYRSLLVKTFSPQSVAALGEKARQLAIELIEGFKAKGECDFVQDFALHLPTGIFMSIVDAGAEDRLELVEISTLFVRGQTIEDQQRGAGGLLKYARRKIAERRANPGKDLISSLIAARINDQPMNEDSLIGMVALMFGAGLDTVASMMAFFARFLAMNPNVRSKLIENPQSIRSAVEELLRRFPVANNTRQVRADCILDGVQLLAGDMVLMPSTAISMDDRVFDQPEVVDIERKNKQNHGTFGDGPHKCIGAILARVELKVFIEEWLQRIPDFSIKPGANLQVVSGAVAGLKSLPLAWNKLLIATDQR